MERARTGLRDRALWLEVAARRAEAEAARREATALAAEMTAGVTVWELADARRHARAARLRANEAREAANRAAREASDWDGPALAARAAADRAFARGMASGSTPDTVARRAGAAYGAAWAAERRRLHRRAPGPCDGCPACFYLDRSGATVWDPNAHGRRKGSR
jgi:hypothetical protein